MFAAFKMKVGALAGDTGGNVAMLVAFCCIPLIGAGALAVDMTARTNSQAAMQAATDSAALALAQQAHSMDAAGMKLRAEAIVAAALASSSRVQVLTTNVSFTGGILEVSVGGQLPTTLGKVMGYDWMALNTSARVPVTGSDIELALVLDNTGSMNGSQKLANLKLATTALVEQIQASAASSTKSAKIAIVPFAKAVNVGPANSSASWIDFTSLPGNKSDWEGCVDDRSEPFDAAGGSSNGDPDTWYPASNCQLLPIVPLTSDWTALKATASSMNASGNTNITIGLAWGMNMLTQGAPLSNAAVSTTTLKKVMIVLTDGDNTENRTSHDPYQIDARTRAACSNIKAAGITIYTVRVIAGNASLLQDCASSTDKYFGISAAAELNAVFASIAAQLRGAMFLAR